MSLAPPPPSLRDDVGVEADGAAVATRSGVSWWKVGALGATAFAGCAYVALYDPSTSSALYPACPFKVVTGLDCPGCGITRALHALFTGDPLRALDHNAVFVVALPLLVVLAVRSMWRRDDRPPPPGTPTPGSAPPRSAPSVRRRWTSSMTWATLGAVGVFWVVRNLPWAPFDWLASGTF